MARAYYTFYCPYCRHRLTYRDSSRLNQHGCSFMHCPKCGKTSIDAFTTEPAFEPLSLFTPAELAISSFFHAAAFAIIGTGVLALLLAPDTNFWVVAVALFLVFWLLLFLYEKKNRNRILREEWEASDLRLRDSAYAVELANFGFKVPPQYLPADFQLRPSTVTHDAVLIQKPASLKKYPGPRADRIDVWHPERD